MVMNKAFKYRIYPTDEQKKLLCQTFGCVRYVWNHILAWRSEEYRVNKTKINYSDTSAYLTNLKKEHPFLAGVSAVALQQALRNQDRALSGFLTRRVKYPSFKKKHGKQSFRLATGGFTLKGDVLRIAKFDRPIKVAWSRPLEGNPLSITLSRDSAGRYFVSFLCDPEIQLRPALDTIVGIDVGLTDFAITSDGKKYKPAKLTRKYEKKLTKLQRRLSKKVKGGKNRDRARLKVARVHTKIADSRRDFLQKLSTKLINENQVICLEDLNVAGMAKNHKLSVSIHDASWSSFISMLEYKAAWYGRTIVKVSPWYPSSQICSACGYRSSKKALDIRKWTCSECGALHDRDINAAINILTAGTAELARGVPTVGQPVAMPVVDTVL